MPVFNHFIPSGFLEAVKQDSRAGGADTLVKEKGAPCADKAPAHDKRKNAVMIGRRIVMLTKAYAATEAVFPLPRRIPAQVRACPAGKFTTAQISIAMPLIASASGSEE